MPGSAVSADDENLALKCRVLINTHMMGSRNFFASIVKDSDFNRVLGREPSRLRRSRDRALARFLWFWPRIEDAEAWAKSLPGSPRNPEQYLHEYRTDLMEKVLEFSGPQDSLLELGCNCGSDMNQLYLEGYRNLKGVDASSAALDLLAKSYPELAAVADLRQDLFQRYLMHCADKSVDFIYSNGATIELVHPSFPIVSEMCRVAKQGVLVDISERKQGFPRDYVGQFVSNSFQPVFRGTRINPDEANSQVLVFLRRGIENGGAS